MKILNNVVVYKESENNLEAAYTLDGKDIIPINSSPSIISTTKDFILPGQLPSIKVVNEVNNKEKIIIKEGETVDSPVNGYSFNISNQKEATNIILTSKFDPSDTYSVSSNSGNLLNVFFKWNTFVKFYSKAYAQADIVNALTGLINEHMFGLCELEIGKPDDFPSASSTNSGFVNATSLNPAQTLLLLQKGHPLCCFPVLTCTPVIHTCPNEHFQLSFL
jgi:hypothetical protein